MAARAPYPGNAPAQRAIHSQKTMTITWGYYFRTRSIMTLPVLFVTLAALALRFSFTLQ